MAVRFLPPPGADAHPPAPDRGDLAEVIDLRSRLAARRDDPVESGDARDQADGRRATVSRFPGATSTRVGLSSAERSDTALTGAEPGDAESGDAGLSEPESLSRSAAEDGVRLLARKARSNGELRRELMQLGHDHGEIEAALLEFESRLYLDDLGLARVTTENLRERKRASRAQIRMKLRERLLPDGVIEEVLGELDDDDEYALLQEAAQDRAKRLGSLDRQTAERRLLGFLARRGWSGERAVRAAREALDGSGTRSSVRFE